MKNPDREMDSLFNGLEARQQPPETARLRAFEAAHMAFEEAQKKRRLRTRNLLALAAALTVAVLAGVFGIRQPDTFRLEVADATLFESNGSPISSGSQITVTVGDVLSAQEPARLRLGQATDLRLNRTTSIRWLGHDTIELTRGSVFIDTGDVEDMTVVTSRGTVRDIGTQFLVTLDNQFLEVAVRSGKTVIDSDLGSYQASADGLQGDVVTLLADRANSRSEPLSAGRWDWIHEVPRGYEETAVAAVLEHIARDLGLRLEYADAGTHAWVMNLQLQGETIGKLPPQNALDVVASTSGLTVLIGADGSLTVARR